jgi:hypothetical protein
MTRNFLIIAIVILIIAIVTIILSIELNYGSRYYYFISIIPIFVFSIVMAMNKFKCECKCGKGECNKCGGVNYADIKDEAKNIFNSLIKYSIDGNEIEIKNIIKKIGFADCSAQQDPNDYLLKLSKITNSPIVFHKINTRPSSFEYGDKDRKYVSIEHDNQLIDRIYIELNNLFNSAKKDGFIKNVIQSISDGNEDAVIDYIRESITIDGTPIDDYVIKIYKAKGIDIFDENKLTSWTYKSILHLEQLLLIQELSNNDPYLFFEISNIVIYQDMEDQPTKQYNPYNEIIKLQNANPVFKNNYELIGIVKHIGGIGIGYSGGHYVAYVNRNKNYLCNDANITEINDDLLFLLNKLSDEGASIKTLLFKNNKVKSIDGEPPKLKSIGNNCYSNSILQLLSATDLFTNKPSQKTLDVDLLEQEFYENPKKLEYVQKKQQEIREVLLKREKLREQKRLKQERSEQHQLENDLLEEQRIEQTRLEEQRLEQQRSKKNAKQSEKSVLENLKYYTTESITQVKNKVNEGITAISNAIMNSSEIKREEKEEENNNEWEKKKIEVINNLPDSSQSTTTSTVVAPPSTSVPSTVPSPAPSKPIPSPAPSKPVPSTIPSTAVPSTIPSTIPSTAVPSIIPSPISSPAPSTPFLSTLPIVSLPNAPMSATVSLPNVPMSATVKSIKTTKAKYQGTGLPISEPIDKKLIDRYNEKKQKYNHNTTNVKTPFDEYFKQLIKAQV